MRRRVEVARRHVHRFIAAGRIGDENVMPHAHAPFVPMTEHQPAQPTAYLFRLPVVADVDVRHERDLRAVSREEQRRLHARGELRHLARLAAADIHDEHLRRACPGRDERELPAVSRETRRALTLVSAGEQLRRRRPVRRHDPDVAVPAPGLQVGRGAHEGDLPAVCHHLRIGHANGRQQIVDRHRPAALRAYKGRQSGRSRRQNQSPAFDSHTCILDPAWYLNEPHG